MSWTVWKMEETTLVSQWGVMDCLSTLNTTVGAETNHADRVHSGAMIVVILGA
jgi:hypothetical protein